jgi:LysM repeat protein
MPAQRPSASVNGLPASGPAGQRGLSLAVSTAALPAVIMSSMAMAEPASATPANVPAALQPFTPAGAVARTAASAHSLIPARQLASHIPARAVPMTRTPATYTVRTGDTVSAIAARHGLDTQDVLRLNNLSPRSLIHPGEKLRLSGSPAASPGFAARDGAHSRASGAQYVVRAGDTMSAIAVRHGVSLGGLLSANSLSMRSVIYPGQKIRITGSEAKSRPTSRRAPAPQPPTAGTRTYTVRAGDTLSGIAARHGVGLDRVLAANSLSRTSIIHPGQKIRISGGSSVTLQTSKPTTITPKRTGTAARYTVKSGDTLGAIAGRHGVSLQSLMKANNLSSTLIHPGQRLRIPGASGGTSTPAPTNLVPSTFLHYTYPDSVVADANRNKQTLNGLPVPSRAQMQKIVASTARSMGVEPSLALAFAYQESGFDQRAVSPANAIGTMQVIPMSGEWASQLVGRKLNLLDPHDNATAGVAIIRALLRTSPSKDVAIASYYQGQYSVKTHGMFKDTKAYVASVKAHQKNFQ